MFENSKVMKKIFKKGLPTPYSIKDMIKTLIELDDPEAICFYLKANTDLAPEYIYILVDALMCSTNDVRWYEYLLKISKNFSLEAKVKIKPLTEQIERYLDMYYAYNRNIFF